MLNETTYGQTWHAQAVALAAHDSFAHWRAAGIDDGDVLDGHHGAHGEPAAILLYRSGVGAAVRIRAREPPAKAIHCQKTNVATSRCSCIHYFGSCSQASPQTEEPTNREQLDIYSVVADEPRGT